MNAQELIGITPAAAQMVAYVVTAAIVMPIAGLLLLAVGASRRLRCQS